jgi:hypothetical protein
MRRMQTRHFSLARFVALGIAVLVNACAPAWRSERLAPNELGFVAFDRQDAATLGLPARTRILELPFAAPPAAVRTAAFARATSAGLDSTCTRFFGGPDRFVVIPGVFCGRALEGKTTGAPDVWLVAADGSFVAELSLGCEYTMNLQPYRQFRGEY